MANKIIVLVGLVIIVFLSGCTGNLGPDVRYNYEPSNNAIHTAFERSMYAWPNESCAELPCKQFVSERDGFTMWTQCINNTCKQIDCRGTIQCNQGNAEIDWDRRLCDTENYKCVSYSQMCVEKIQQIIPMDNPVCGMGYFMTCRCTDFIKDEHLDYVSFFTNYPIYEFPLNDSIPLIQNELLAYSFREGFNPINDPDRKYLYRWTDDPNSQSPIITPIRRIDSG